MAKKAEPTLTYNDKTYNVSELSEDARKQIVNVQATEAEIKRLQVQLAIAQTARNAYQQALVELLPKA